MCWRGGRATLSFPLAIAGLFAQGTKKPYQRVLIIHLEPFGVLELYRCSGAVVYAQREYMFSSY